MSDRFGGNEGGQPDVEGADERRRSFWRAVALAFAVIALLPPAPTALSRLAILGIPTGVYLLAFQWRRPFSVLFGIVTLTLLLVGFDPSPAPGSLMWRAWGLLIGGGFVVTTAVAPERSLFARSLAGVGLAFAAVAATGALRPEILDSLDDRVVGLYNQFFFLVEMNAGEWEGAREATRRAGRIVNAVYPATVALASMGALCLASYIERRVRGIEAALEPLRRFRFSDHFAWWLVIGLVVLVVPLGAWSARVGGNIVTFMAGLYALRGLAVLAWLGTTVVTSGWWTVVWVVAAILFYPVTLGTALVMGLSDTWLDLRSGLGVESNEK